MKNTTYLKDLGTLHWQEIATRKLYNETLMLNKNPKGDLVSGEMALEELTNRKEGYKVTAKFDLSFLRAKLRHHICTYFGKGQEREFLQFCKDTWQEYKNEEIEEIINQLVLLKGGTKEEWLAKLK